MCVRFKELVCPCTPVLRISVKANDHPRPITSHTYIYAAAMLQQRRSVRHGQNHMAQRLIDTGVYAQAVKHGCHTSMELHAGQIQ
jgi:hypothetical protein